MTYIFLCGQKNIESIDIENLDILDVCIIDGHGTKLLRVKMSFYKSLREVMNYLSSLPKLYLILSLCSFDDGFLEE